MLSWGILNQLSKPTMDASNSVIWYSLPLGSCWDSGGPKVLEGLFTQGHPSAGLDFALAFSSAWDVLAASPLSFSSSYISPES